MIIMSYGTPFSSSMIFDDLSRMGEMTSEYFWGENAPIQHYHDLMVDIERASELVYDEHEALGYISYHYPPDAYGNHRSGWLNTVLKIFNTPNVARTIEDCEWQAIDNSGEEEIYIRMASNAGIELFKCISAANSLTKKQMLELFPKACELMISFMEKRTAFEVIYEILREIELHSTRFNNANVEGDDII